MMRLDELRDPKLGDRLPSRSGRHPVPLHQLGLTGNRRTGGQRTGPDLGRQVIGDLEVLRLGRRTNQSRARGNRPLSGWQVNYRPEESPDTQFPVIPGADGAGTIAAVGSGVQGFKVGDPVYATGTGTGFYAEFLTPLFGPEHRRDGKPKATRRVAGVVSQQLRYLEVLLLAPWTVSLSHSHGFPFQDPRDVRIANPASFLAHKV